MRKKLNCVLLVDDNEHDNYFHTRVLEKSGITDRVVTAINGREALDILVSGEVPSKPGSFCNQPDLIFLDINMPVMNGWQFLEEYQKLDDAHKGKMVVIMLTTSLNPADKQKAIGILGNLCFHFKPLTLEMIDEIIQMHFSEHL